MTDVHQLIGQDARRTPWRLIARCGYTEDRHPGSPMPASITAWASRVSCTSCILFPTVLDATAPVGPPPG